MWRATYKAAKVPLVEQLASAAEQKAQQLQFKLQVAEQKAAEAKGHDMHISKRKWNKILTSYPLVGQLLPRPDAGVCHFVKPVVILVCRMGSGSRQGFQRSPVQPKAFRVSKRCQVPRGYCYCCCLCLGPDQLAMTRLKHFACIRVRQAKPLKVAVSQAQPKVQLVPVAEGGLDARFSVYVPDANRMQMTLPYPEDTEEFPVVLFLSDMGCSDLEVLKQGNALEHCASCGLILVAADTSPRGPGVADEAERKDVGIAASYYVNATQSPWNRHYRMRDYLENELLKVVHANFPTCGPEWVSAMGHGMGGMGALALAIRNPERFRSVSALAPICHPSEVRGVSPDVQGALSSYLGKDEAAAKQAATLRTAGFTQASQSVDASASPQSEPQGSSEQRGQTQELPMNTLQQVLGAALDSAKLQASATAVISQASSDLIALSGPSPGGSATPAEADAGPAEEADATPKAAQLKRSACQETQASSDLIALSGPSPGGSATPAEADAGPAEEEDATPKAAQLKRSACQDWEGLPAKASSDLIALSGPSPGGSATPAEADAGPAEEADATPKAAQLKRSACQDLEGLPAKASSDLIALSGPSPGGSATMWKGDRPNKI
ncbi:unnamed protein product [Effrenium voratum]|uniref:S-formylglutathione hydrolase n=1 Tax=Effrenium voratum TaxID=2562239 RepID=A0AA36HMY2_9DINO|nr:unnamed protein product [Effrenium voratum]